ncbi:hypothetical protein AGMMS49959_07890 [Planctomycetales bacterium]|nr:hypothetical protein AGMMS49959_07890 [Planctomycetales bacterium]
MLQIELGEQLSKLQDLRAACPPPANGNLRCPACPHLTYLEFLSLFDNLQKNLVLSELQEVIAIAPQILADGVHLSCPLLRNGVCLADGGQGIFCHLGEDLSLCLSYTPERVEKIFLDLNAFAAPLHDHLSEPYFLNMLNIYCWFAVLLDDRITQPLFKQLREKMRTYFDVKPLLAHYRNHTKLKERLDLIDKFFHLNANQRAAEALACMEKVRADFPFTGAYYGEQSDIYVKFMEELLKVVEQQSINN